MTCRKSKNLKMSCNAKDHDNYNSANVQSKAGHSSRKSVERFQFELKKY